MEDYQDPEGNAQENSTLPFDNTIHEPADTVSTGVPQSFDARDTQPPQNKYVHNDQPQYAYMHNNSQPQYGYQQVLHSSNAPANNYRPQYPYPPMYPPHYGSYNHPARGKATAALVLGIISLVFCWMSVLAIISIVCSIIGIVMGNSARKQLTHDQGQGQATAGMICSIIGLVLSVLMIALFTVLIISAFSYTTDFGSQFGPVYGM